jgi:hypothetical protein
MVIALFAPEVSAATWVNVGTTNNGSVYDVDWDSLGRNGNLVTFTLRVQYSSAAAQSGADGFVALRQANCADRSFTDLHTDYMLKGKVLNSTSADDSQRARPSTIGAGVVDKVCSK